MSDVDERWEHAMGTGCGYAGRAWTSAEVATKSQKNIAISVVIARIFTLCNMAGQKREQPVELSCVA
jgi:hypothetical protein